MEKKYRVEIDSELEEIIPLFFDNTRQEVGELAEAAEKADYATLERLGHSIKGASLGYGFMDLADIGQNIEYAAKEGRPLEDIRQLIRKADTYLDKVQVVYR